MNRYQRLFRYQIRIFGPNKEDELERVSSILSFNDYKPSALALSCRTSGFEEWVYENIRRIDQQTLEKLENVYTSVTQLQNVVCLDSEA